MEKKFSIYWILILAAIIRLILSFLPAFEIDMSSFRFWADKLAHEGPANFYSPLVVTNYPLVILYYFWLVGSLKDYLLSNLDFAYYIDPILKLAGNLSDLLIGLLIYKIIKEKFIKKIASISTILYVFNPGFIFNSAIWGQYDSVAILFLVMSVYFCLIRKNPVICSIFFSLALFTKPQSLALAPFLVFFFIKNFKPVKWVYSLIAFILTAFILLLGFFPNNLFYSIFIVSSSTANLFDCTTCFALNFWGIFGNWQKDTKLFLSLPLLYWGFVLYTIFLIITFGLNKLKENSFYLTISVSMLGFFMLLTRMHERYIYYFLPFMLISAILLKSRIFMIFYLLFSFLFLINLYIPYAYYNNAAKITNLPLNYLLINFSNLSFISFISFLLLFIYYLKYVIKNNSNS